MTIELGKTEASLINPPNEGVVKHGSDEWQIARTGDGRIALRNATGLHPDFSTGMYLLEFCQWINGYLL